MLRDCWESTSFALDKLQANPECVQQEQDGMKTRKTPVLHATIPSPSPVWQVRCSWSFATSGFDSRLFIRYIMQKNRHGLIIS